MFFSTQVRQIVTMNATDSRTLQRTMPEKKSKFVCGKFRSNPKHTQSTGTMLRVLGAAQKREVKATQNLSIIVLFFMICWIPLYTINCIKAFCSRCEIDLRITLSCIVLSHFNSAINPFLYAYHLRDFRLALKNFIMRMFGMKVPPSQELNGRLSLHSHHQVRLASMMEKRNSLQPRIYIDSPVWLRSQQQDPFKVNGDSNIAGPIITKSLNCVHNTVAAIARSTSETQREMWNIIEVPSIDESHSKENHDNQIDSANINHRSSVVEIDYHFTTDLPFQDTIDNSSDETSQIIKIEQPPSSKTKSENDVSQTESHLEDQNNTDVNNDQNIFLIENDTTHLASSSSSPLSSLKSSKLKIIPTNSEQIFKPKIESSSYDYNNKNFKTTNKFRRSYTLRNSLSSENIHKPSPLKVVSGFIFPINNSQLSPKNSTTTRFTSLQESPSNILSSNIINGANTLKRTLSDS